MPDFTITVTDRHLARLQQIVSAYNSNTGKSITVAAWILLHLKELAVSDDLNAAITALKQQTEADANATLNAAIDTERRRLIAELTP